MVGPWVPRQAEAEGPRRDDRGQARGGRARHLARGGRDVGCWRSPANAALRGHWRWRTPRSTARNGCRRRS
jgi:hypothetical protein